MKDLFKTINEKDPSLGEDWFMCQVSCGNSCEDGKDYFVVTNHLHGTDVPSECDDAKTFSALICRLLNEYYNK